MESALGPSTSKNSRGRPLRDFWHLIEPHPCGSIACAWKDPEKNSLSHVFGQSSICVAMDFPGWAEAGFVTFMLSGFLDTYVVFVVFRHVKTRWQEAGATNCAMNALVVLAVWLSLCFNSFFCVFFSNPVTHHRAEIIVLHTVPYLAVQVGFTCLILFQLKFLRPDAAKCQKIAWYVFVGLYLVQQTLNYVVVIWSLAEVWGQTLSTYQGPKVRYQVFRVLEPGGILCLMISFCLHSFRLEPDTKVADVDV